MPPLRSWGVTPGGALRSGPGSARHTIWLGCRRGVCVRSDPMRSGISGGRQASRRARGQMDGPRDCRRGAGLVTAAAGRLELQVGGDRTERKEPGDRKSASHPQWTGPASRPTMIQTPRTEKHWPARTGTDPSETADHFRNTLVPSCGRSRHVSGNNQGRDRRFCWSGP